MSGTVVVSQLGARMHYAVPRIFHRTGRLERLYTDICATVGWPRLLTALPPAALPGALRRLSGRVPQSIPRDRIGCFEAIGLASVFARTMDTGRAADTSAALTAGRRFSAAVARQGFGGADTLYAISGECLEQLRAARDRGLATVVEQIIAPRQIVDELVDAEIARHPDWGAAVEPDPHADAFAAREKAEWALADIVVCPSEFVRDGIARVGGPVERCVVVPYGVDVGAVPAAKAPRRGRPLRVLTAGAVGLRKGSPYVLEVARRLQGVAEFRMVGGVHLPSAVEDRLRQHVELTGTVPRSEMAWHYAWADVFFLPSVCEGSATVIYEALGNGLPVVTTPNAGSVVRDGIDGFVCSSGDADGFAGRIETLARDDALLGRMSVQARLQGLDHDVASYGRRLLAAIGQVGERAGGQTP